MNLAPDRPNPLPRELAPGVHWLGECFETPYDGRMLHAYNSVFLVRGSAGAMLIETGLPFHLDLIEAQIDQVLDDPGELRYVWATHQETPHASGLGRLLTRYPEATVRGDVRDYHLVFPQLASRFVPLAVGESLDLGDREFVVVEPIIKDLITTQWGYDSGSRSLFPGDGYAYAHYHDEGQCGRLAEEVPALPVDEMTALFAELALYWTTVSEMEPYARAIAAQLSELDVALILPTHGLPIGDPKTVVPRLVDGLLQGAQSRESLNL